MERREEINYWANTCPFTLTLVFKDRSSDTFKINQRFALDGANAQFKHSDERKLHNIIYSRVGSEMLEITVSDIPNRQTHKLTQPPKYQLGSPVRGEVLIVNVINFANDRRDGAQNDTTALERVFRRDLGYNVTTRTDLTKAVCNLCNE